MSRTVASFCRNCLAYCPIIVSVEGGRAVKVSGDREAPLYDGYTCPKGRALPEQHNDLQRLLACLKRDGRNGFAPISAAAAIDEIAGRIEALLARDGPRSVAMYAGTGVVSHPPGPSMAKAFFRAIGSPMVFSAATIDKPAANTSTALHGNWVAGAQTFETSDVWMIVGANPVIAKSNGLPSNNPGQRLKEAVRRGLKLIVLDPRRTETAKRAHVHLQCKPGEDPVILAAMIHMIIAEGMVDAAFVAQNALGLDALRAAVAPFTPEFAAMRAGVETESLREAARTFGRGRRGGVVCSTGPSFSTHSNLSYYLALCLNTICGRWARAGDDAPYPNVLLPAFTPKAQPYPPYPVYGKNPMRVLGLRENASGMPTAALADEILTPGAGRVRALFCLGGNPLLSWPDQAKAARAIRDLELLVVFDYRMTATAKLAHYVIPPPLSLELPGTTQFAEALKYNGVSRGFDQPWAQYTPAVVAPPAGSEVVDEGEFFFRLAQRMHLQLDWLNVRGYGPHLENPKETIPFDMRRVPSTEELIGLMCKGSRIPLDEVKRHPHGHVFSEARVPVQPRDAGCDAMLDLADPIMMAELGSLAGELVDPGGKRDYPYRLVCRRSNHFMNSVGQTLPALAAGRESNPLYMHPEDISALGLEAGAWVRVRSPHGEIVAAIDVDGSMKPGVVSIYHGFDNPEPGSNGHGRSVSRLIGMDEYDPITGIPRMSGVAVAIVPR
jgi:anaerobic selenocysteine-containing dehydrogenase